MESFIQHNDIRPYASTYDDDDLDLISKQDVENLNELDSLKEEFDKDASETEVIKNPYEDQEDVRVEEHIKINDKGQKVLVRRYIRTVIEVRKVFKRREIKRFGDAVDSKKSTTRCRHPWKLMTQEEYRIDMLNHSKIANQ